MKRAIIGLIFILFSSCNIVSDYLPGGAQTNQGKQRATGPDSIAPTVNISYPIFAQKVGAICQFIGTAIDTNSGVDKVFVRFDDGAFQRIKCNDGIWITNIEIEGYGLHTNYVYAIDVSNNVSITNQVVFYRAPVPSVIITSHSCFDYTNAASIRVYGNCAIDYPFAISNIQISVNGAEYVDVIMTNSWQYDWLIEGVTLLNSHTNYILARAIGNNGTTNLSSVVFLWLEKNKPFISIDDPDEAICLFASNYTVWGKATDNDETGVRTIYLKLNNGEYTPTIGTTNWYTNIKLYGITNKVKAYAVDFGGNVSMTRTVSIVRLDTNNPTVSITNVSDYYVIQSNPYEIYGLASDGRGTGVETVYVRINGGVYKMAEGTTNWNTNMRFNYGTNTLEYFSSDFYKHSSPTNTIRILLTRPAVSFIGATKNIVTEATTYRVEGTASDKDNQVKEVWCKVNNGSFEKLSGTTSWYKDITLSGGTNSVYVFCNNLSGRVSTTNMVRVYKKYWQYCGGVSHLSVGEINYGSMAIENDKIYVAFGDSSYNYEASMYSYVSSSWYCLSKNACNGSVIGDNALVIRNNLPVFVYRNINEGSKLTILTYSGKHSISSGQISKPSITWSDAYGLLVVFEEDNNITIMRNNDGIWFTLQYEGKYTKYFTSSEDRSVFYWLLFPLPIGFSSVYFYYPFANNGSLYPSIKTYQSGSPYIAFMDTGYGNKASVKTWRVCTFKRIKERDVDFGPDDVTAENWDYVGTPGFSDGAVAYTTLDFNSQGTPYVAYSDGAHNNGPTVKKYNGSSWETVGNTPGMGCINAHYTQLVIDKSTDIPYVVFCDGNNGMTVTVKRYNGSDWETVGVPFSPSAAEQSKIVIDSKGTPYVLFKDWGNGGKASVMVYK